MSEKIKQWRDEAPHSYARYVSYSKTVGVCPLSRTEWLSLPEHIWTNGNYADEITPFSLGHPPKAKSPADLRAEFLDVVKNYVTKDRNTTHGDAEDNFKDIADFWNILFGPTKPFTPADVASAMICVKLSRIKTSPNNLDHWHDIAGYAACGGGIIMKGQEK